MAPNLFIEKLRLENWNMELVILGITSDALSNFFIIANAIMEFTRIVQVTKVIPKKSTA